MRQRDRLLRRLGDPFANAVNDDGIDCRNQRIIHGRDANSAGVRIQLAIVLFEMLNDTTGAAS
jgi:hypothetical protein